MALDKTQFSINALQSNLKLGGARQNLFSVQIVAPGNAGTGGNKLTAGASLATAPFLIQSASLPAVNIGNIEVPYMGRKFKLAGDRTFPAWGVSVINDEDFGLRNVFEEWLSQINGLQSNLRTIGATPGDYKAAATVTQYAKDGTPIRVYTFVGLFPTDIGDIALDWSATDQIETFPVTFQYDYWTVTGTGAGGIV